MTHETDARFAGSIPAVYDRYLVPLLFEAYARDIAARFDDLKEGVVLEIAAGTGVVTRALVGSLPKAVRILATDFNEAMLRVGAGNVDAPSVTWQQADAQKLPFEDASADAMVCQFGVMFMPDRRGSYREAWRVLRPAGRYVFNVWDRVERNETTLIAAQAVAALFPDDPPGFIERTPFGYFDVSTIRQDVESAGFQRITIETVEKVSTAPSAEHVAIGLCQGTPLRGEIEARDATRLDEAISAVTQALVARFGTGSFENRMSAHVVTAWPYAAT